MSEKEKLYETLGELLYAVAKSDGVIQEEETEALKKLFENHPWGKEIMWSFNYEDNKASTVDEVYNKVISYCHSIGATPEFEEFKSAMNTIAQAADGVDAKEDKIITSFSKDLIIRFQKDLEK